MTFGTGYSLRGHQFTDASGRYTLETVKPADYSGRTAHIHVKIKALNGPKITSRIYFPGNAANARDSLYNPLLVVKEAAGSGGTLYYFNFVARP